MRSLPCACRQDAPRRSLPVDPMSSDANLKALLARLVDTLEAAHETVANLARDLASDRWQGLPPPSRR
jgi:hypothetical protein